MALAPVRVSPETRDSLLRLKLQLAARAGRDITMGETVSLAVNFASRHINELSEIIEKQDNKGTAEH